MRDTELNRAFKYFADDVIEVMNGELDSKADLVDGKVPSTQLPSYVDDTVEGYYYDSKFYEDAQHTTEITGESGKIYIDVSSNKSYRWTGSVYTRIDECPAFGETQGTIYEGNKGKQNTDDIGTMSNLTTTAKTSLVEAINEVGTALSGKQATLVVGTNLDSAPTENSTNPVTSGGVYTALAGKANTSDLGAASTKGFDATPTAGNTNNAVSSDGVYQALAAKLNKADVDDALSSTSANPVQNKAVQAHIARLVNNGVKNVLDFQTWIANCSVVNATKTVGDNTISIAADGSDSYTEYLTNYPTNTDINVNAGDTYQLSWTYSRTGGSGRGYIYVYAMDNSNTVITSANAQGTTGKLSITIPTGATKLRLSIAVPANTRESYRDMMICPKSIYDNDPSYQPYAPSNRELYEMILALQSGT